MVSFHNIAVCIMILKISCLVSAIGFLKFCGEPQWQKSWDKAHISLPLLQKFLKDLSIGATLSDFSNVLSSKCNLGLAIK